MCQVRRNYLFLRSSSLVIVFIFAQYNKCSANSLISTRDELDRKALIEHQVFAESSRATFTARRVHNAVKFATRIHYWCMLVSDVVLRF